MPLVCCRWLSEVDEEEGRWRKGGRPRRAEGEKGFGWVRASEGMMVSQMMDCEGGEESVELRREVFAVDCAG